METWIPSQLQTLPRKPAGYSACRRRCGTRPLKCCRRSAHLRRPGTTRMMAELWTVMGQNHDTLMNPETGKKSLVVLIFPGESVPTNPNNIRLSMVYPSKMAGICLIFDPSPCRNSLNSLNCHFSRVQNLRWLMICSGIIRPWKHVVHYENP